MTSMLFIDPGDVHVGMAQFTSGEDGTWTCTNTWECTPELAEEMVERAFYSNTHVVVGYERFRLFGHLAMKQVGSEFRASQLIGVIRYLHRRSHTTSQLVVQDPNVQPVALSWTKKKNIVLNSVSRGRGGHAKSAELHGWFFIGRNPELVKDLAK